MILLFDYQGEKNSLLYENHLFNRVTNLLGMKCRKRTLGESDGLFQNGKKKK